jgi:hypothetical protein
VQRYKDNATRTEGLRELTGRERPEGQERLWRITRVPW